MDNTIRNLTRFTQVTTRQELSKINIAENSVNESSLKPDSVTISEAGKAELSKEDQDNINKAMHKLAANETTQKDDKTEEGVLDEMIAELQEQLKELQQEMIQLRLNDDEDSKAKLELLELELVNINAQLLELNNRKIEMLKG
jgi:hypothetical protein